MNVFRETPLSGENRDGRSRFLGEQRNEHVMDRTHVLPLKFVRCSKLEA